MKKEPEKGMGQLYDMGWKKGYAVGFKSGLAAAAGLAFMFVMSVGQFMRKR